VNNTNRALNRSVILVTGLALLAVATLLGLLATQATLRDAWASVTGRVGGTVADWLQSTPLGNTRNSWIWIIVLTLLLGVVGLLLRFILRQGRGHSGHLINEQTSDWGTTQVDSTVAEQALQHALGEHPEFLSTRVSTYRVSRDAVLKVSVTCRRGTSPADVVRVVEQALLALDELLGLRIPALLQISGGFRVRTGHTTRVP
jgi:predicted PurR-regulated permease PerM